MPKKLKEGPFGIFQHLFCRKTPKKLKRGPFEDQFFWKKNVPQCPKNSNMGPFSLAQYCILRGKKGKTFLILFPGPTGTIWRLLKILYNFW